VSLKLYYLCTSTTITSKSSAA